MGVLEGVWMVAEGVAMLGGCAMPEEWMRCRANAWTSEGEDTLPPTTPVRRKTRVLVVNLGALQRTRLRGKTDSNAGLSSGLERGSGGDMI